jgi:hypothetical protein
MPEGQVSLRSIDLVQDLLDRLRLDHVARRKGAVIVEGTHDATVLRNATELDLQFFPVGGRVNVLRAADRLDDTYLTGVVCVADSDFDDESDNREHQWFVVFTDDADLEAMLYWSSALDRVLDEWATTSKYKSYGGADAVREGVEPIVAVLAILRWWNLQEGAGLNFDSLDLQDVVSKKTVNLNVTGLLNRLSTPVADTETLRVALEGAPPTCPYTHRLRARGRDRLAVVSAAMRSVIGDLTKQQVAGGLVERSLRLAARPSDFAGTPFLARFTETLEASLAA